MNTFIFRVGAFGVASALLAIAHVAGCSSDPKTTAASTTTKRIRATEGGTISDSSGSATLTISPGALDKDTDISLSVRAASGAALTSIYDFGPNGTTFLIPAKLDIQANANLATAGMSLVVATGTGGTFQPIAGSTYINGVASAPVAHFTDFTVIGVANDGGSTTDGGTNNDGSVADTGTTNDATTDSPTSGEACGFKGNFFVEKYMCGSTDITSTWKQVVPTETLVVTDRTGGGCTAVLSHTASACVEVESFDATLISGSSYTISWKGISSCNPSGCKFVQNDAPCAVGDRVGSETATITFEGAKFHIITPREEGDICGGQNADILFAPQ